MPTKKTSTPGTPSTAVAVKPASKANIVSIQAAIAAQVATMGDRIAPPGGSKIKLAAGSMTLPDGSKTPGPLEVVVVDFVARNMFYENAYDKDNIESPVCFAIGTNPKTLVPSPNSPLPQAASCAACPMNLFKSAANGKGKACKNERSLAVLPPEGDADTPLWVLNVSPTGLQGYDGYVADVLRTFNTVPAGVVTTVSLDANLSYPSLLFSNATPNPNVGEHFSRQAEAMAMLQIEPDTSKRDEKPVAKAAPKRPIPRR
jgi:hypothetical protein